MNVLLIPLPPFSFYYSFWPLKVKAFCVYLLLSWQTFMNNQVVLVIFVYNCSQKYLLVFSKVGLATFFQLNFLFLFLCILQKYLSYELQILSSFQATLEVQFDIEVLNTGSGNKGGLAMQLSIWTLNHLENLCMSGVRILKDVGLKPAPGRSFYLWKLNHAFSLSVTKELQQPQFLNLKLSGIERCFHTTYILVILEFAVCQNLLHWDTFLRLSIIKDIRYQMCNTAISWKHSYLSLESQNF